MDRLVQSENTSPHQRLKVSPNDLIRAVANHYHIKQIVIRGKRRQKSIVKPRHVAMYLLKDVLDLPYTEIGRWFSNRDHTSAIHAYNKIAQEMTNDELLMQEISAIRMSLAAISR